MGNETGDKLLETSFSEGGAAPNHNWKGERKDKNGHHRRQSMEKKAGTACRREPTGKIAKTVAGNLFGD